MGTHPIFSYSYVLAIFVAFACIVCLYMMIRDLKRKVETQSRTAAGSFLQSAVKEALKQEITEKMVSRAEEDTEEETDETDDEEDEEEEEEEEEEVPRSDGPYFPGIVTGISGIPNIAKVIGVLSGPDIVVSKA